MLTPRLIFCSLFTNNIYQIRERREVLISTEVCNSKPVASSMLGALSMEGRLSPAYRSQKRFGAQNGRCGFFRPIAKKKGTPDLRHA